MARETVGGRIDVAIDGVPYSTAGEIDLDESNIEPDAVVNQDGTINRTVKPSPYSAKVKMRNTKDLNIQTLMGKIFDLTLSEKDIRRTTLFTDAFIKGKASRNTATGEYSEFEIVSDKLTRF
ncbi:conserved hypothetical protein [Hyphomicrobium denitrificans ATCC 51888]|uniref:Phage tail protein n=1 Tax=Hyphomicrobium denitrificans (strain ATCC 51888 / DSM 1869 / NCIMB 11706 / TK 0415) TaxID=582899 RepID=D8JWC7_HYPDA|nr:phage tail tube protein [Hyphomicrobium denitrificans]ADJ23040.1 conserved hypothetical protein [Hyphomicrobium denitrificans ATCC 51888]